LCCGGKQAKKREGENKIKTEKPKKERRDRTQREEGVKGRKGRRGGRRQGRGEGRREGRREGRSIGGKGREKGDLLRRLRGGRVLVKVSAASRKSVWPGMREETTRLKGSGVVKAEPKESAMCLPVVRT
jgi:hypothetical protein